MNILRLMGFLPPQGFDPDASAFFSAAGITDATQKNAVNQLVKDLKGASLWSKLDVIYPFVGGTATTHKYNLKDPRDLDAAYRLVYDPLSGSTHDTGGAKIRAYTFFNIKNKSTRDFHIGIYSVDPNSYATYYDVCNTDSLSTSVSSSYATNIITVILGFQSSSEYYFWANSQQNLGVFGPSPKTGFFIANSSSTSLAMYKNASSFGTGSALNATWQDNTPWYPTIGICRALQTGNRKLALFTIGSSLTQSEITAFNTIVQTYQTTLGRQV